MTPRGPHQAFLRDRLGVECVGIEDAHNCLSSSSATCMPSFVSSLGYQPRLLPVQGGDCFTLSPEPSLSHFWRQCFPALYHCPQQTLQSDPNYVPGQKVSLSLVITLNTDSEKTETVVVELDHLTLNGSLTL